MRARLLFAALFGAAALAAALCLPATSGADPVVPSPHGQFHRTMVRSVPGLRADQRSERQPGRVVPADRLRAA